MSITEDIRTFYNSGWIPCPEKEFRDLLENASPVIRQSVVTMAKRIQALSGVGVALSAERNLPKLLEQIVREARNLTRADGGSLYLLDEERTKLYFKVAQTESLGINMDGTRENSAFRPIPLYDEAGGPNHHHTSVHCALTGEIVNISDVYSEESAYDFTGPKEFDMANDYRTKSQLSLPLRNHGDEIIGVLQLINAQDAESGEIIPFSRDVRQLALTLASQAAVAITNAQLIRDREEMFNALIRVIAGAIDEKSPYTGGHIERVARLTMRLAEEVNADREELPEDAFNEQEMEELRLAAWLHDIGKITTPEWILNKSTKLETLYDRGNAVRLRFEILKRDAEITFLREQLKEITGPETESESQTKADELRSDLQNLEEEWGWIQRINRGDEITDDGMRHRIAEIAGRRIRLENESRPLLSEEERENLAIRSGTLNDEERQIIRNHVAVTRKMLEQLPYPKGLESIPRYAGAHHERLDGSGYPDNLQEEEIPLQARIMALADVFEALTARDRPYTEGKSLSEAMKILGSLVERNHIDGRLFRVFIRSGLVQEYAEENIDTRQIDCLNYDMNGNTIVTDR